MWGSQPFLISPITNFVRFWLYIHMGWIGLLRSLYVTITVSVGIPVLLANVNGISGKLRKQRTSHDLH